MTSRLSLPSLPIAIAAGLASAGLYATLIGASIVAMPLFLLAPVPVMVTVLALGTTMGLVAAATAVVAVQLGLGTAANAAFTTSMMAPALVFAHLFGRATPASRVETDAPQVWYPLGALLQIASLVVTVIAVAGALAIGFDPDITTAMVVEALRQTSQQAGGTMPDAAQLEPFIRTTVRLMPAAFPATWLVVLIFDLWAAVKLARLSRRLSRPREDVSTVELPIAAGLVFVVSAAIAVFVPGTAGLLGEIVAGTLVAAHFLVGLAVIHALTRASDMRWIILSFVYGVVMLFTLPAVLIALLGLFDPFLGLRRRQSSR